MILSMYLIYIESPNIAQISHCEHLHLYSAFSWIASVWTLIRIPSVQFQVRATLWNICVLLQTVKCVCIWLQEEESSVHNFMKPKLLENCSGQICVFQMRAISHHRDKEFGSWIPRVPLFCLQTIHTAAVSIVQYVLPTRHTVLISV